MRRSAIDCQTFEQSCRGGDPQYGLGDKGIDQHAAIMAGTSPAFPRRGDKFLDPRPFQAVNHLLQLRRQRADFASQFRHQCMLDDLPMLQDSVALRSIDSGRR